MSKLIKNMLTEDLKTRLTDVGEVIVVEPREARCHSDVAAAADAAQEEDPPADGARTAWPGGPRSARRSHQRSSRPRACWRSPGAAKTSSIWRRNSTGSSGVKDFEGFECRGGALDGSRLDAAEVKKVAKWPTRSEQLSLPSGQIIGLAATLAGQIGFGRRHPGRQISSRVDDLEKAGGGEAPAA